MHMLSSLCGHFVENLKGAVFPVCWQEACLVYTNVHITEILYFCILHTIGSEHGDMKVKVKSTFLKEWLKNVIKHVSIAEEKTKV